MGRGGEKPDGRSIRGGSQRIKEILKIPKIPLPQKKILTYQKIRKSQIRTPFFKLFTPRPEVCRFAV